MKTPFLKVVIATAATVVMLIGVGCESSDGYSGSTSVSVGYYGGSGWYDPYYRRGYYGGGYRPPHHRPPGHRPPVHRPPGGRPPTARPLPSRPRPRPQTRRGGGRGRR